MLITTKKLAKILKVTQRLIQKRVKDGIYVATLIKNKIHIDVDSLPLNEQKKISLNSVENPFNLNLNAQDMVIITHFEQKPKEITKETWVKQLAIFYGISESSIKNKVKNFHKQGILHKPKITRKTFSWDQNSIDFLKSFYLNTIKKYGECTKSSAYKACVEKAKYENWKIGSKSSAYEILKELHPLLETYARGGRRSIDNYFYIKRDSNKLNPFQIVIGDQHIFDYWIADYDKGLIRRPECYLWLDMSTKLVYGISFDKHYNSSTVRESLRLGLKRFGAFDCTYNDNGSSECSKAINEMIDDLHLYQMEAKDIAQLYKKEDGTYAIEDDDENLIDSATNIKEWHRKHRRIFAGVKNAKAKDIERFFRTLESRLTDRHLPGRVASFRNVSAAVDEVERQRLENQKDRHELLTEAEFIKVVIEEINAYEEDYHSTLKMSPRKNLMKRIEEGFSPRFIDHKVIDLICSQRLKRKVIKARININNFSYIGENLSTVNGVLNDVGLSRYEGKLVDIRYLSYNPDVAYALIEDTVRPLRKVQSITMLDDESMLEALKAKKEQIKAVTSAFLSLSKPESKTPILHKKNKEIQDALKRAKDIEPTMDGSIKEIMDLRAKKERPKKKVHLSEFDKYKFCLDLLIKGFELNEDEKIFVRNYEVKPDFLQEKNYWITYKKLGGLL